MFTSKNIKCLFVASMVALTSCSAMVKVKYLRPAEINLGARKKVAVLNFNLTGSINDWKNNTYSLPQANNSYFSNELINTLIDSQYFKVVEREDFSKVLAEQGLNASGFVEQENAIKIGKLIGTEMLMMGTGTYNVDESYSKVDDSVEYSNRIVYFKKAYMKRSLTLNLSYRIVDTQTGEILTSKKISSSSETSVGYFPLKGTEEIKYKTTNNSTSTDPFSVKPSPSPNSYETEIVYYSFEQQMAFMKNWQTLLNESINSTSNKIVYQITPHYVEEQREVTGGDNSNMKQALELVNKGDWENAKYLWESVIKDPLANKDYVNAMNNLGIYYELNNDFDNSIFYFDQAYKYSNDRKYLVKKERVEDRKRDVDVLKEQGINDTGIKTKRIPKEQQTDNIDHAQLAAKFQAGANYPEAIKEYEKALEKNSEDLYVNGSLASLYYTIGKYENALNYYNKVIMINPAEATNYFNLALALQALGRTNEAKDSYLKSCNMGFKTGCDVFLGMK